MMKKWANLLFGLLLLACRERTIAQERKNWAVELEARQAEIKRIIDEHRVAFGAFDTGSLGDATLEMIPYVVFRVLQELEPESFGNAALASFGFFGREDTPTRLNGISWTRPTSPDGVFEVRYMTRTCASCHVGRVRLEDDSIQLLYGNANTEMNLHLFIGRLTSVLQQRLGETSDSSEHTEFRERIVTALKSKRSEWFWGADSTDVSPENAKAEVEIAIANIDAILERMRQMNNRRLAGMELLQTHSYMSVPDPFDIEDEARARGRKIFDENCAGCHYSVRGRTRDSLIFYVGTDPGRADAISTTTVATMEKVIRVACPPTQTEFVLDDKPLIDPTSKRGYVANALHGTWAQAPYLHNGSIPTLRQLLVPALRTRQPFLRGSISYNQNDGGWEWEPSKMDELRERGDHAIALHDIRKDSFSNVGHGSENNQFIIDGKGNRVRIAWNDSVEDKSVVDDLIAYLLSL